MLAEQLIKFHESSDWKTHLEGKYLVWAEKAELIINSSEEKKSIWNTEFNDAKSWLKSVFTLNMKRAYDSKATQLNLSADDRMAALTEMSHFIYDDIKKIEKQIKGSRTEVVKHVHETVVKPMAVLYDRLLALKPLIVKGRKPDPSKPAKAVYVPPMSARKDLVAVNNVFDEMLVEARKDLIKAVVQRDIDQAAPYLANLQKGDVSDRDKDYTFIANYYAKPEGLGFSRSRTFEGYAVKPEGERRKIALPLAEREVDGIIEQFKIKNISKVTSIVGERGDLKAATVVRVSYGRGSLEARIKFEFNDGGEFTVNNQVVSVWVYNRKAHYRFPTTFHDIKFSNGKKIKSESEEFMNKEWAKEHKIVSEKLKLTDRIFNEMAERKKGTVLWIAQRDGNGIITDKDGNEHYFDSSVTKNFEKINRKDAVVFMPRRAGKVLVARDVQKE